MIVIRCKELTTDEQLALAEEVTSKLGGAGIALARGPDLVLDQLGKEALRRDAVEGAVKDFLARRPDGPHYSYEWVGDSIVVHSADPIRAMGERRKPSLPDNVFKCPFCAFVTPYEELYVVHYRSHGFV